MDLCRQVIDWLVTCYRTHTVPHYFIPEQNLIGHLSHDICNEVHDWLVCLRADLCRMSLSSVQMNDLPDVTGAMCGQLVSTLCVHDWAREVLEEATDKIQPGSLKYKKWKRYLMGCWSTWRGSLVNTVLNGVTGRLDVTPYIVQYWVSIPETILLPIIDKIHSLVKEGYGDMFSQLLYRHMGDNYLAILCYLYDKDVPVRDYYTYNDWTFHYYTLGREMVHPDGWSAREWEVPSDWQHYTTSAVSGVS